MLFFLDGSLMLKILSELGSASAVQCKIHPAWKQQQHVCGLIMQRVGTMCVVNIVNFTMTPMRSLIDAKQSGSSFLADFSHRGHRRTSSIEMQRERQDDWTGENITEF